MDLKFGEIQSWLENEVLEGSPCQKFEVNESTIDYLYTMMQQNKTAKKKKEKYIQDYDSNICFYEHETKRLDRIANKLGLTLDSLGKDIRNKVDIVAEYASQLSARNPDEACISLMMVDKAKEEVVMKGFLKEEKRASEAFVTKQQDLLNTSVQLEKLLASLNQQQSNSADERKIKSLKPLFLKKKMNEYKNNISNTKQELVERGLAESFYHHNIVKKAKMLRDEKAQLEDLKVKVNAYRSLPADITLSRVQIEQAKQELVGIQVELKKYIGSIEI